MPLPIPDPLASGFTSRTPVPLFWCSYGTRGAPPALVLHGGPGASHDYLLPQMLELSRGRELFFYDQRGGGRSKTDAADVVTWRTQADDLELVIGELALAHAPIVGYSWGGLLALLHSLERSRNGDPPVSRLALIDPAPLTRQYRLAFESEFARRQAGAGVQALRAELAESGLRERDPEAYRQRAFELSVAGYFSDPRASRDLTPFRVIGRVQQSIWESLGGYDLVRDLGQLRIPALFVHGREDPIPLASSEEGARAMGAPLVVLERCGHVPYVEQPAALFAALGDFLNAAPSPRRE